MSSRKYVTIDEEDESKQRFQTNILPPSSGPKLKPGEMLE
jgi:hypothetical protein